MIQPTERRRTAFRLFSPGWMILGIFFIAGPAPTLAGADGWPLHEAQFKGSHNSYERYESVQDQLGFNQIRQLEFDLRYVGGEWVVYHDTGGSFTWCYYLSGCLQEVKIWSDENPGHHVVFIWLDLKDRVWLPGGMESLDEVITENLDAEPLFTPDQLRRWHADHQTAVRKEGWPALESLRNHFIIVLTGTGAMNDAYALSTQPALLGRPAFVNYEHNSPLWDFGNPRDPVRAPYRVIFNLNLMHPIPAWKVDFISEAHAIGLLTRAYNLAHDPSDWALLKQSGLHIFSSDWVNAAQYPYAVVGNPLGCHWAENPCDASEVAEPRHHIFEAAARTGDMEGESDSVYFAFNPVNRSGEGETFSAGVTHAGSFVEPAAKACLMARESSEAAAPHFAVCRSGGRPLSVYYRTARGERTSTVALNLEKLPVPEGVKPESARFLKLTLDPGGRTIGGYGSYDSRTWQLIARITFERPLALAGPAVSSAGVKNRFSAWFVRYARNGKPVTQFAGQSCIGSDCVEGMIFP